MNILRNTALLNSSEYEKELHRLSREVKEKCNRAENEATVSSIFETQLYYFTKAFFGKEAEFSKEVNVGKSVRHVFNNKRMDAVTNQLIIEYKHTSKLQSETDINEATKQITDYLRTQAQAGNSFEAVLTDGLKTKFFSVKEDGSIRGSSFAELNSITLDKMIKNILFCDRKKLAGSNIANDFKIASSNKISNRLAVCLFNSIKDQNISQKTNMLFNEWRDLFHLSEADKGKNRDIDKRRKALGEIFNCEIAGNDLEYKALFCLQTTYAIIVKLTALKLLNQITLNDKEELFEKLSSTDSNTLKNFLQQLEDGFSFKNMGVRNLLEGDFFAWYCDDNQWNNEIFGLVKNILDILDSYEDLKFTETYEPQDLFKDLYVGTIPQQVRHSLGEYFTPMWLADSVVSNSLATIDNVNWRGIDPCCGSGIFLLQMIKKILNNKDITALTVEEKTRMLNDILCRVKGIDLNPLSVLTARVNYFITISKLIEGQAEIEIPVYLGDSANLPVTINIDGVNCYKYSINTQKQTIDIELPVSFVKSENFSKIMFSIQTLVKAEKAKAIATLILENIPLNERTENIKIKIENLANNLVVLHQNKWDGIWVRILFNFMSTAKLGTFNLIVGNPPWVKWEFLPQSYANKIKTLCIDKHLFSGSYRTGGISLNVCALIASTAASKWLIKEGTLAFLMPKTLMTQQSYEGFRNFYLDSEKQNRLYIQRLDDWSKAGSPFETAQEKCLTYFYGYNFVDYQMAGIPVKKHCKKKTITMNIINNKKEYSAVQGYFDIENNIAVQLTNKRTNFTFIRSGCKYSLRDFRRVTGKSSYKARSGAEFTPGETYFLKSVKNSRRPNTYYFKNDPRKTSKYRVVPKDKIELETTYIYPLIKGPRIKSFYHSEDSNFAIFPYNWGIKDTVSFMDLNEKSPKLSEYLTDYEFN